MSTNARGTKRVCPSCGAKFYDLNRSPILCPVCQTVYQLAPVGRRSRAAAQEDAEPEAVVEEVETPEAPVIISLEEAEEPAEADAAEDEEGLADLGDDDEPLPDDGDDDTFLEEDEDDDTEVSGLLSGSDEEEA
jgi:uncharacterized protein (TIGR02300 family)